MKISYQKLSALIVDSYAQSVDTVENYLEPVKLYRIWTAKSADEALKVMEDRQIDLVIAGWKMRPMSGLQLLEAIRKRPEWKDVPVLLMIDQIDGTQQQAAARLGAAGIVMQPIKPKALLEMVDQILSATVDESEENFLAAMEEAKEADRKRDWNKALVKYREALTHKEDEQARMSIARILHETGNLAEAEKAYMDAIRANPSSLKAFLALANIYQQTGRLDDALKVLHGGLKVAARLKESGHTRASILFNMGEIELKLKRLQSALGHFDEAAQASQEAGGEGEILVNIGDSLVTFGYLSESENYYLKALELDPALAHVYNRLAMACRKQGKLKEALALYERALSFHPEDENLFYNLARTQFDVPDYDKAVDALQKALLINPEFPEALKLLDLVMQRMGHGGLPPGAPPQGMEPAE